MKTISLSLIVILLSLTTLMAQEKSADHLEKSVLSLDLFAPGITFEGALGDFTSFVLGANAGISFYAYANSNGESGSSFIMVPVIKTQIRNYYNFSNRNNKAKKTWYNSANYAGFNVSVQTDVIAGNEDDFIYEPGVLIGPFWGFQRNGTFTFNLNIGFGYYSGTNEGTIFGELKFGLNISHLTK